MPLRPRRGFRHRFQAYSCSARRVKSSTIRLATPTKPRLNAATSTGLSGGGSGFAPELAGRQAVSSDMAFAPESSFYNPNLDPAQNPSGGYTSSLEQYETTDYSVRARTQQFDALCVDEKVSAELAAAAFDRVSGRVKGARILFVPAYLSDIPVAASGWPGARARPRWSA